MKLPNDVARCDGLLPKLTQIDGKLMLLWSIDCPRREECARYCQVARDDENPTTNTDHTRQHWVHVHAPSDECPDFLPETTDDTQ